jgi:cytochrome P450
VAQHLEVDRRLRSEVDCVLAGRTPTVEDLSRLHYTSQVIDESMRLYPPAWAFTRKALARDLIDGWLVPADAIVVISPYVNHRLERFWPDPERFDPDRFAPERVAAQPPFAYFPFGGGAHSCIGRSLSLMEVTLAMAMIARAFRLELVPCQRIRPEPRISLLPRPGILMKVVPR